jgi:hypothetical protein
MSRGLTDAPLPEESANTQQELNEALEMVYEMQQVVQELINRHNDLVNKVEKLETTLTEARIQFEAQKLVWNKGL